MNVLNVMVRERFGRSEPVSFGLGTTALELAALDVRDLDVEDFLGVEELVVVDVHAEAQDELRRLLVVDVDVLLVVRLSPVELIDHVLHDFLVLELALLLQGGELLERTDRDAQFLHLQGAVPRGVEMQLLDHLHRVLAQFIMFFLALPLVRAPLLVVHRALLPHVLAAACAPMAVLQHGEVSISSCFICVGDLQQDFL